MSTGFIYIWTNIRNNKKYIGSHYGSIDDNYKGSGVYFRRAYIKDPNNFIRNIIELHYGDRKTLLILEESYLKELNVSSNKEFYNLSNSAGGGENHSHLSQKKREEMYRKWNESSTKALLNKTPDEKRIIKEKKQESWKNSKHLKKHSDQTRKRRNQEESEKSAEEKEIFSLLCKSAYWTRSVDEIENHHKNQSNGVKEWHKNKSPELEKQRIDNMKQTKKNNQCKQMNNGFIGKLIPKKFQERYLFNGWVYGMLKRNTSS